jgi:hypothetical protein
VNRCVDVNRPVGDLRNVQPGKTLAPTADSWPFMLVAVLRRTRGATRLAPSLASCARTNDGARRASTPYTRCDPIKSTSHGGGARGPVLLPLRWPWILGHSLLRTANPAWAPVGRGQGISHEKLKTVCRARADVFGHEPATFSTTLPAGQPATLRRSTPADSPFPTGGRRPLPEMTCTLKCSSSYLSQQPHPPHAPRRTCV